MSAALRRETEFARVQPDSNSVVVSVAGDLNALMRVFALRAMVYMAEQVCPHDEEFDGNDFAATTHLLAEIDGEPVGTLRLRWFNDFVKFERAAVRKDARGQHVTPALMHHAMELARRRGYRRVLVHMQARLVSFWRPFGFLPRDARAPFVFSDHEYIEGEALLEPHPNPIGMDTPPLQILRPEGRWDEPGPLDASAARAPTNPHDEPHRSAP